MSFIVTLVLVVAAFVAGILVGRNNKAKVESAITAAEDAEAKIQSLKK